MNKMSSLADDYFSQVEMVLDAYLELQEINPDHELLSLIQLCEDKRGFTRTQELIDRYSPRKEHPYPGLFLLAEYQRSLECATRGMDYKFKIEDENAKPEEKNLAVKLDDDLPF